MNKPICKECEKKKKKYSVYTGMSSTTLIAIPQPYWNEDGQYVSPRDPNTTTQEYSCSNGHRWSEVI